MKDETDPNGRILIASGTSVPTREQLRALMQEMIPLGMVIDYKPDAADAAQTRAAEPENISYQQAEIRAWNREVERKRIEKKFAKGKWK